MEFNWKTEPYRTELKTYPPDHGLRWLEGLGEQWRNPFLIIDSEVRRLWDSQLQQLILPSSGLYVMEAGEVLKNTFTLTQIWDSMSAAGISRDTPVVIIGGGLVCDIGALAASTYLRGLEFMLIPTTLLCMVDACLGGKTGVNLSGAKNQVGTFCPAGEVAISTAFLSTLPEREMRCGMAEALKTAIIGDRTIVDILKEQAPGFADEDALMDVVERCLQVKAGIVMEDLLDRDTRMLLNLGHTVGHALESVSEFRLSHGEAVGLGLMAEAFIAAGRGGGKDLPGEIRRLLDLCGLPTVIDGSIPQERLAELFKRDKKTRRKGRTWALPFGWHDCRLVNMTPEEEDAVLPDMIQFLKG